MPKQRKQREGVKQRPDSKFWWASYTDASGQRVQRSTGTTNKREALALLSKWKTEVWNQTAREIEPDRTLEQLVVRYLNDTRSEKRSSSTDVKRFRYLAVYFPEKMLMNDLGTRDVLGYVEHRQSSGVSNKTINKELSLLSSVIKWSKKRQGWDLPNPVIGLRLPEVHAEARCLSFDEFARLLDAAKKARPYTRNYLPEFCILGFNTMMRPGEMLNLEWDRVDFENKVVRLEVRHTKGKERRLVPLNEHAQAALVRLPKLVRSTF